MAYNTFQPLAQNVALLESESQARRIRNLEYLMSLTPENLLLSHYLEAGLVQRLNYKPEGIHWGWDSPLSEIRGTVVGHWLSAAARIYADIKDIRLKARADFIVSEIARCQDEHGDGWAFGIPEKYLYWLKRGKATWASHYVCHKDMMGLLDMVLFAGNRQALDILLKCADWFYAFSNDISSEQMNRMMNLEETGGIMELWADLYDVTHEEKHLELMRRYERTELFAPLLRGEDVLTNMHTNMTIPEVHGAARAYEVTGEERYRKIVENYWDLAVTKRGMYATGGQTSGEIWTPMNRQSARLGEMNQEHCVVYNMMRLCEYLLRWTGKAEYADYWERNLYNGIFAQGYWRPWSKDTLAEPAVPKTETVSYYLPLAAGSHKHWGSETEHFWCCHCTMMQANANHREGIYYLDAAENAVAVCQFIPSVLETAVDGAKVRIEQTIDRRTGDVLKRDPVSQAVKSRPRDVQAVFRVTAESGFILKLRRPWWVDGGVKYAVNGVETAAEADADGFIRIEVSNGSEVRYSMPKKLTAWPLADRPDYVAFLDGPVVLAGLVGEERMLYGDRTDPASLLIPDDERIWSSWLGGWKTVNQPVGIKFRPLYEIGHEVYTVYFPVKNNP